MWFDYTNECGRAKIKLAYLSLGGLRFFGFGWSPQLLELISSALDDMGGNGINDWSWPDKINGWRCSSISRKIINEWYGPIVYNLLFWVLTQ